MPDGLCEAIQVCSHVGGGYRRRPGERCADSATRGADGHYFCWTHRTAFDAGMLPESRIVRVASGLRGTELSR